MLTYLKEQVLNNLYQNIVSHIEYYAPKVIWAISIMLIWLIISLLSYKFVIYLFRKFKVINLIDSIEEKMDLNFSEQQSKDNSNEAKIEVKQKISKLKRKKLTEKINVTSLIAKAISYYIFLVFFRYAVSAIGIPDIEEFLKQVQSYLPDIFLAACIWYFWVRFSDTVYDIVYYALELTKHHTSKIIAMGSKIVVIFITILAILKNLHIDIIDDFILNTVFVGFITTITLASWIAFWLWWKDVARDILESFRK